MANAMRPRPWTPAGRAEDAALPVDFRASQPHYIDHLAPVYLAMENRGRFCVPEHLTGHAAALGIAASPVEDIALGRGPVVVASYADLRHHATRRSMRHLVLFEHGAGFSFSSAHPCYAGGAHQRGYVRAFLCPNEWAAIRNRLRYPQAHTVVVGCPKLDALAKTPPPLNPEPVVAVSFHWECLVAPETRSAYPHFAPALADLARRFKVLGHAHPRNADAMREAYEGLGIEFVADFAEVCARADVYVNDASSTAYEFAALGRPVVIANAPWYRKDVHHGLRFWDHADVGVQVDEPGDLIAAVESALCDPLEQRNKREMAVEEVYPHLGKSAVKAASILDDFAAFIEGKVTPHVVPIPETEASRGVLYVAIGDHARELAKHSAETLRRWHDLPVAVVSDGECEWSDVHLQVTAMGRSGRWHKVRMYDFTPWDETLYLDADTEVVGPVIHGFNALADGWDMAVAQDIMPTLAHLSEQGAPDSREAARVAALLPTQHLTYANSGVIFFRQTNAVRELFRLWREGWEAGEGFDQMALAAAFYAMPDPPKVWLLSQRYNSHIPDVSAVVQHNHHTLAEVRRARA